MYFTGQWLMAEASVQGFGWKKYWIIAAKEAWCRGMWMGLWEWTQSVKIFVSHTNIHQKATIMKGALSNQINKMS